MARSEISYDEQRYPARPRRLRPRDQMRAGSLRRLASDPRKANGTNPAMWRNPYARPDARRAIETTNVWFTAYPISLITRPGESDHAIAEITSLLSDIGIP